MNYIYVSGTNTVLKQLGVNNTVYTHIFQDIGYKHGDSNDVFRQSET